jgi:hypothetical protein
MSDINIIQAFEDSKIFGLLIKDQSTFTNWKVAFKTIFGLPMNEEELKVYREYTGRKNPPREPFKEVFLIIGRRGGKSFAAAIIAVFLAVFKDWTKILRRGEVGYVMCLACDRRQASVVLNYIKAMLRLPIFQGMVEEEYKEEIELKNQVTIAVHTCSYRSLRGYTILAAICDELAFFRIEGANPAEEILTALRPSLATVSESMLLAISTPYSRTGPLYEAFSTKYGQPDPDVLVWKAPSKVMNPTIQDKVIKKALDEDYAAAKAEWLAEFREDLAAFLPTEMIEAAIIPSRWELLKIPNINYKAFVDPSGGRADSFTLAIAHSEERDENLKIVVLDRLEERRPPFSPQNVVKEFSEILKRYGIFQATADRYAGEWVTEAFRNEGISLGNSELDKSELYLAFEPMLAAQRVELLDNKRMFSQLRSLERRTRSGGKDRVDHPPGLNDDLSNVVAGACVLASKETSCGFEAWIPSDDDEDEGRNLFGRDTRPIWVQRLERELLGPPGSDKDKS